MADYLDSVGGLRSYVRATLSCDSGELSDDLIDAWLDEAAMEVHAWTDWPFLDTIWELSTASTYTDFSQITDADSYVPKRIVSIILDDSIMEEQTSDELRSMLAAWDGSTSEPRYWGQRGGRTLILAQTPDQAYTFTIRGYRARYDWVADGASGVPDVPADLRPAIAQWAIFKGYQWMDDPQTAMHYFDLHIRSLERFEQSLEGHANSFVLGGGQWRRDRDTNVSSGAGVPFGVRYGWQT